MKNKDGRDFQKSKVYKWENEVIGPRALRTILFEQAQMFIDGVWLSLGLKYPPEAVQKPKNATRIWADATRMEIRLPEQTPAWVLLHELAHALTGTFEGESDGHGADFVGMYIKLLDKVLNIPLALTMYTLEKAKIKYNLAVQPRFTDDRT